MPQVASTNPVRFLLLVYRMPAKPTSGRVAVWRQLKRIGGIYLHQALCIFPDTARTRRDLKSVLEKIEQANGEFHLLPLRQPSSEEYQKLVGTFVQQTTRHYQEIIENCEVNFQKEIEFETFRKNFTYEEAEEIRIEFDKISNWFDQVSQRDLFGAPNREEAHDWLKRSETLLEGFEAQVYEIQQKHGGSEEMPTTKRRRRGLRRRGRLSVASSPSTREAAGG